MIVGDVNPSSLASNLQLTYHPIPELKLESKIQTGSFPFASHVCKTTSILEYSPGRSTISLAVRNPKRQSGGVTFGILQRFTNSFCAGAELLVAWSEKNRVQADVALAGRFVCSIEYFRSLFYRNADEPLTRIARQMFFAFRGRVCAINCIEISDATCVFDTMRCATSYMRMPAFDLSNSPLCTCRYSFPKSSLAATVSKGAMDVSFWHQPSDNLQVGASLNYNNLTSKAIGSLCYQLEMKKATIKGMIDTDWTIGCTYDR